MSAKTLYWLTGPGGSFVQVEGAVRRDEFSRLGWSEAGEPGETDRVWLRHNETGAVALFGAHSLPVWRANDWDFVVPATVRGDTEWVIAEYGDARPAADIPEPAPPVAPPDETNSPTLATGPALSDDDNSQEGVNRG